MLAGRRDAWIIFLEEFRTYARSRWYLISTAVVVVLLVAAMVAVPALVGDGATSAGPLDGSESVERIGYVDESGTLGNLAAESGPRAFADRGEGVEALQRGDIDWLYVMEADYLATGSVQQYGEFPGRFPGDPAAEGLFRGLLSQALLRERVEPEVADRVLAPADFESYRVDAEGSISPLPSTAEAVGGLLVPILFAGLLGLGLAVGAGNMVQSVSEEKESRLVEVVITSASPFSVMAGKLLALTAIGLAQAAVWIVTAAITVPVMFGRISGLGEFTVSAGMWLTIVSCFVTGYFLVATLAILMGAIAPSNREATGMGSWISLIGFVPIWFAGVLMWQPDGLPGRLLSYVPLTAYTGMLVRLGGGGDVAPWKIVLALLGVLVLAGALLWVAIRVFRAAILMRGQSVTARNLWAALRGTR